MSLLGDYPKQGDKGHRWRTNAEQHSEDCWKNDPEYGAEIAYDVLDDREYCGGPTCVKCGYWYCQHCHPDGAPRECVAEEE